MNNTISSKQNESEKINAQQKIIVKSVYLGTQKFSEILLKIAENKTIKEMGIG